MSHFGLFDGHLHTRLDATMADVFTRVAALGSNLAMVDPRRFMLDVGGEGAASLLTDILGERRDAVLAAFGERMQRALVEALPDFADDRYPVAFVPLLVRPQLAARIAADGAAVRSALSRLLRRFREEHARGELGGPLHRRYELYLPWWDLIGGERRRLPDMSTVRFDGLLVDGERWRCCEVNSTCPNGLATTATIHALWLRLHPAGATVGPRVRDADIDDTAGVRLLYRQACSVAGHTRPVIAAVRSGSRYLWEIDLCREIFYRLKSTGLVDGEFLVGDVREIECDGIRAWMQGHPLSLIYNKLDKMLMNPSDPELRGWMRSVLVETVEHHNSMAAAYLAGTKRCLAVLQDPSIQRYLDLPDGEVAAIERSLAKTYVLDKRDPAWPELERAVLDQRESFVLKPDNGNAGKGVVFGAVCDEQRWACELAALSEVQGVAQERLLAPLVPDLVAGDPARQVDEFLCYSPVFYEERFVLALVESDTSPLVDTGKTGKARAAFVLKEPEAAERV
jgi:hypothetical protein